MASVPSYHRVDYRLRLNKAVQRKMMCDAFRRLSLFGPLRKYQYVGFASPFYSDFVLFHKALGVTDMINVEKVASDAPRMDFNRPFGTIQCLYGTSASVLPTLPWRNRAIVWLDDDLDLGPEMIEDIGTVCSRAPSGTFFVVSFRAEWEGEDWKAALRDLRRRFGSRTPTEIRVKGQSLALTARIAGEGGYARALARIALSEMASVCRDRSGGGGATAFRFEQLLHFEYDDGTPMVTVGGLVVRAEDESKVSACDFPNLEFVRLRGSDPYVLKLPKLTHRETRYLDQKLPLRMDAWKQAGLTRSWARKYEKVYRWYPTFAETEL